MCIIVARLTLKNIANTTDQARYSGLEDEKQKKSVFNGGFLSNLVGGGHSIFNFCLGGFLK